MIQCAKAEVIISFSNQSKYQAIHKLTFWGKADKIKSGKQELGTAEFLSTLYMITEALIFMEFFHIVLLKQVFVIMKGKSS